MSYNTLWKPYSEGGMNRGGASFLAPKQYKKVSVVDASGNVLEDMATSPYVENGTYKYYTRNPGSKYGQNVFVRAELENGKFTHFALPDSSKAWGSTLDTGLLDTENDFNNAITLDAQRTRMVSGGGANGMQPGQIGYGAYPAYLGDQYPDPSLMKTAPYKYTDPQEYAAQFGEANREEYAKNFELAKKFSLDTINQELSTLQGYVPAASALKRSETSIDNVFNQAQRTAQIEGTLPGMRGQLAAQGQRAESYANGRLPDSMQDRGLELGFRSQAADMSTAGGFGARSSASKKASDLMSAERRFQIGQYGEGLLTQNAQTRSTLELAPTAYSDAGQQVKVNPTVSPAQLTAQQLSDINQYSMITPSTALQSVIQQNQFSTNLEQGTRQTNQAVENSFKLGKFNYDVSYAGAMAGALQTDINTNVNIDQQNKALEIANANANKVMDVNETAAKFKFGAAVVSAGAGFLSGLFKGFGKGEETEGGGVTDANGTVRFPDGSYITKEGVLYDKDGNKRGKYTTSPDNEDSFVFIPSKESNNTGSNTGNSGNKNPTPPDSGNSGTNKPPENGVDSGNDPNAGDTNEAPGTDDSGGVENVDPYSGQISLDTLNAITNSPAGVAKTITPPVKGFALDTNLNTAALGNLTKNSGKDLEHAADVTFQNIGLSNKPSYTSTLIGHDLQGKAIYSDREISKDQNPQTGLKPVTDLQSILSKVTVSGLPPSSLDTVKSKTLDRNLVATLDSLAVSGKFKSFVNTLQTALGNATTGSSKIKDSVDTAYTAYKLAQAWKGLSGAQKALAISSLGLQSIKTKDGKKVASATVDRTVMSGHKPMTLGAAINIDRMGANVAEVAAQWEDLSSLQLMVGKVKTPEELVKLGQDYGFISK